VRAALDRPAPAIRRAPRDALAAARTAAPRGRATATRTAAPRGRATAAPRGMEAVAVTRRVPPGPRPVAEAPAKPAPPSARAGPRAMQGPQTTAAILPVVARVEPAREMPQAKTAAQLAQRDRRRPNARRAPSEAVPTMACTVPAPTESRPVPTVVPGARVRSRPPPRMAARPTTTLTATAFRTRAALTRRPGPTSAFPSRSRCPV